MTMLLAVRNLKKEFGDKEILKDISFDGRMLFKKSSFYIMRGERIGLFGDNGCGKSTLIKIMLGDQQFDGGSIFFSSSVKLGYISQSIEIDKNDDTTVLQMFDIKSNKEEGEMRRILVDAVIDSIGMIRNKLPLCNFFDNVLLGNKDKVTILVYNIEGELLIKTLVFDGSEIYYKLDATKTSDKYVREYSGNRYIKEKQGSQIVYSLYQNDKFVTNMFSYRN